MFDPLSPVCLTCVSAPYCPQARYTFLALAWLKEAYFNIIQLLVHEHKQCNVDMAYSHASILLCSHLATIAAVYEQNDSTATKFVKWRSRSLCCSPLCCIVNYALRWHKAAVLWFNDVCKGGNCAPARLGLGQCERRPAVVWGGGTLVVWHSAKQLAWWECAMSDPLTIHTPCSLSPIMVGLWTMMPFTGRIDWTEGSAFIPADLSLEHNYQPV